MWEHRLRPQSNRTVLPGVCEARPSVQLRRWYVPEGFFWYGRIEEYVHEMSGRNIFGKHRDRPRLPVLRYRKVQSNRRRQYITRLPAVRRRHVE